MTDGLFIVSCVLAAWNQHFEMGMGRTTGKFRKFLQFFTMCAEYWCSDVPNISLKSVMTTDWGYRKSSKLDTCKRRNRFNQWLWCQPANSVRGVLVSSCRWFLGNVSTTCYSDFTNMCPFMAPLFSKSFVRFWGSCLAFFSSAPSDMLAWGKTIGCPGHKNSQMLLQFTDVFKTQVQGFPRQVPR